MRQIRQRLALVSRWSGDRRTHCSKSLLITPKKSRIEQKAVSS